MIGGPHGDCGLTGRKIIVDTYGGYGRHGGGAFSGKDPTKVDRSACYMARHIAKNLVAAGLADASRCSSPTPSASPIRSRSGSTPSAPAAVSDRRARAPGARGYFPLTPRGIIEYLDLRRPIYRETAAYGHFGRDERGFTWESVHRAGEIRAAAGLTEAVGATA